MYPKINPYYQSGYESNLNGIHRDWNPHTENSEESVEWFRGWDTAQEAEKIDEAEKLVLELENQI